eukprot:1060762-Rhodomonas_salina.2
MPSYSIIVIDASSDWRLLPANALQSEYSATLLHSEWMSTSSTCEYSTVRVEQSGQLQLCKTSI